MLVLLFQTNRKDPGWWQWPWAHLGKCCLFILRRHITWKWDEQMIFFSYKRGKRPVNLGISALCVHKQSKRNKGSWGGGMGGAWVRHI